MMQVKICGLTSLEDTQCAVEAGADYLGFVLYPRSVRAIDAAEVARIREKLVDTVCMVGVLVDAYPETAARLVQRCGLNAVQLHGEADASAFAGFVVPVWRAVRVSAEAVVPRPEDWPAVRYVADAAVAGQHGGTGQRADWGAAALLARSHPVILAGGLHAGNVAEAIRVVGPLGVDVASGVEERPGVKSHAAVRAFVAAAKAATL